MQVSPEIDTAFAPQPSSQDSVRHRRKLTTPPPPLLPIIETMLDKFYLVGESVEKIHEYVEEQGVFYSKFDVHRILGTYRQSPSIRHPCKLPTTSAGIVTSEAEAHKCVEKRMRMFRFILGLAKDGKARRTISHSCVRKGYDIPPHFLELLVMHGKAKENRPLRVSHCSSRPPLGSYWWGGR